MLRRLLYALPLVAALAASAQTTTITASNIVDISGQPLAAGNFQLTPVGSAGHAIAFEANGKQYGMLAHNWAITNGVAATVTVPDVAATNPGIGYQVQILDNASPIPHVIASYPQLIFPTGSTWSFDAWQPGNTPVTYATGSLVAFGSSVPPHCSGSSTGYTNGPPPVAYYCIGGVYVQGASGSGGAQADWNATTGAAVVLNKPTLATVATSGSYNDLSSKPTIGPPNVLLGAMLAKAATTPVHIVVAGDSFTICDMTNCGVGPTTSTNRWVERLRIQLQGQYGSHGTGIVPVALAFNPLVLNPEAWACTTGWAGNLEFGPSQSGQGTLIVISAGGTCTFHDTRNIAWDKLNVYCATAANSSDLQVSIDGGAVQHVCNVPTGTPAAVVATITSTSSTSHAVVFSSPSGFSYLYAAEGTSGTGGVSVDNVGIGGAYSASLATNPPFQFAFWDMVPGGPQLFIYQDQTNDVAFAIGASTFQTNVQAIITHEAGLAPAPQIMLAIPPVDVVASAATFAPYTAAQKSLCTSNLLNCVSMANAFGPYNASSGLWDLTNVSPGVHPSDLGNSYEYQLANSVIIQSNYNAVVF